MNRVKIIIVLASLFFSGYMVAMKPAVQNTIRIRAIENKSTGFVTIIGSHGVRTWEVAPGSKYKPTIQSLPLVLNALYPEITVISSLGQIQLLLSTNKLEFISAKGRSPLNLAFYENARLLVHSNGFIELISDKAVQRAPARLLPRAKIPVAVAPQTLPQAGIKPKLYPSSAIYFG